MMQSMIFAAGLGTRLKPITNTTPKALVNIGNKTLLERTITNLKDYGFSNITINVHHFANKIINYLKDNNNFNININISDETNQLLNTGGGLKAAIKYFDTKYPILIHNVDIVSNVNLKELYNKPQQTAAAAILLVSNRKTKRYLLFDNENNLCGWTNIETKQVKSPYSNIDVTKYKKLAFAGIHVVTSNIIPFFDNFPKEFSIIDFYLSVCNKIPIKAYIKNDLEMVDVGKIETLQEAEKIILDIDSKQNKIIL